MYDYFKLWQEKPFEDKPSLLEQALKKCGWGGRISNRRSEKTTFLIVDTQSVKNTDTSEHKGYDSGKEISGIKRYISLETRDFFDAIEMTTAGVTDRKGN